MKRFRRPTLIIVGCISLLIGLGLSRKLLLQPPVWTLTFLPALLLVRKKNIVSLILVVLLGLGIGLWRGGNYMQNVGTYKYLAGRKVVFQATAKDDAVYGDRSQIEFSVTNVEFKEPVAVKPAGNIKVSGFGVPMVYRGDRVEVSGKLYPMRGSNQARVSYGTVTVIGVGQGWFDHLSRGFSSGMENALPEPEASFGLGILVGQRTNLPSDVVTQLTMVGLVHIVAVSGYNLTIIVRAVQRLRLKSKYQRLIISLFLIAAFLMVTGFSASIVRAAVVSSLSLLAWYYGRTIKPLLVIVFSAALTAMTNPFYLWSDLGWYLSFLAFFGVLMIAPLISQRLFKRPPTLLMAVLVETFAAEIMTLPLIMMTFGQMSVVGLLANLLIVPLIPAAMLLSTIAALAGFVVPGLCGWFAWPANLLLTYILDFVHLLSGIPRAMLHLSISLTLMICAYTVIAVLTMVLHRRLKPRQERAG